MNRLKALEREHSCLFYMLSCQPSVFQPWSWPPPCLKLHTMPVIVHYFWQAYVAWSKSSALNGEQSFPTGVPKVDKLGSFCQGVTHFYFITPIFTVYFCLTLHMICIVFIYIYIYKNETIFILFCKEKECKNCFFFFLLAMKCSKRNRYKYCVVHF